MMDATKMVYFGVYCVADQQHLWNRARKNCGDGLFVNIVKIVLL